MSSRRPRHPPLIRSENREAAASIHVTRGGHRPRLELSGDWFSAAMTWRGMSEGTDGVTGGICHSTPDSLKCGESILWDQAGGGGMWMFAAWPTPAASSF